MSVSALEEIVGRLLADLHLKPVPNAEAILGRAGARTAQLSDCPELIGILLTANSRTNQMG